MVDIVSELKEKSNEVISLHEIIKTLKEHSPNASFGQIAEWLIIQMVNDPFCPSMGLLTVGGGIKPIPSAWGSPQGGDDYYSLNDLLITLYKERNNWPGDIPF